MFTASGLRVRFLKVNILNLQVCDATVLQKIWIDPGIFPAGMGKEWVQHGGVGPLYY